MGKKEINKIFSKNLTYWLSERGKTQADLYKKMGVSSAVASDWCNEKKMPKVDKMVVIADWLSIELSDLLENKKHSQKDSFKLYPIEKEIIIAYRKADEIRKASVLMILGLEEKGEAHTG